MKNEGKKFEEDFIKSLPEKVFRIRLKDAGGWNKSEELRFTSSNPCDFIIQSQKNSLFILELKTHKGKSIPYSAMKQIEQLYKLQEKYEYIDCSFIINFRDLNKTFIINVIDLIEIQKHNLDRKSFAYKDIEMFGILIEQKLKRIRYKYLLDDVF